MTKIRIESPPFRMQSLGAANTAVIIAGGGGTVIVTKTITIKHANNPITIMGQASHGLSGPYMYIELHDVAVALTMSGVVVRAYADTAANVDRNSASILWTGTLAVGVHTINLRGFALAGAPRIEIGSGHLIVQEFRLFG